MNDNYNERRISFSKLENKRAKGESEIYSKEQYLHLIYLSDKCKRYEDSLLAFEQMIQKYPGTFNREEREIFENSIKCIIKNYQKNLNKISNFIKEVKKQNKLEKQKELEAEAEAEGELEVDNNNNLILVSLNEEKKYIEVETINICKKVVRLIDNFLMKNLNFRNPGNNNKSSKSDSSDINKFMKMNLGNTNPYTEKESEVFLFRLKGDLYKYLSQVQSKEETEALLNQSADYFSKALEIGKKHLDIFDKVYLESVIAYAKFLQDFMRDQEQAMNLLIGVYRSEGVREILQEGKLEEDLEGNQEGENENDCNPFLEHDVDAGVINLLKSIKKMIISLNEK
jgi:hypothetical protein